MREVVRNAGSTCGCDARPRQPPEGVSISRHSQGKQKNFCFIDGNSIPSNYEGPLRADISFDN